MNYRKTEAKEAAKEQFHGVWAAITTPFTPDLQIDEAGLRSNMRRLASMNIKGVFCTGVIAEFWALTKEERKRSVEIVVEEAHARNMKVIAHTAHHSAHETVELTRHAEDVGADFSILINPYYPTQTDEQTVYNWFEFVASRVNIGIWMFDVEYSGVNLSPELTARIASIPNICGIKLPRPMDHYDRVQKLVGDKIVITDPREENFLKNIKQYGQQVFQSSPVPYLYQTPGSTPMCDYAELGLAGKLAAAEKIAAPMEPLREAFAKWYRGKFVSKKVLPIAYVKAWSEMLGMAGGPVRPGLPQITAQEREELRQDLENTGLLNLSPVRKAA